MRLVTRGDLDGLTCAVIITSCEPIQEILLVHPQDITDRRLAIDDEDVLANLPYHPGCGKWFNHYLLTESDQRPAAAFAGRYGLAPSAARMVYEHYLAKHPEIQRHERLLAETDRLQSALLNLDDVLEPKDFILLGFTLDPRTGLGAFQDFFQKLVEWLKQKPIDEILRLPDVQERVSRIREQDELFRQQTVERSRHQGNVVFTDFRGLEPAPVGNRFLVYTLFPQANVSLRAHAGPSREHVAATAGHSIFNRTSRTNVGELMARYGGGGHRGAGTCLLPAAMAEQAITEMLDQMRRDG